MGDNMEIIDYELVTGNSYGILSDRVRRKIDNGWQPFEQIQMHVSQNSSGFDDLYFIQAMVKYKKDRY